MPQIVHVRVTVEIPDDSPLTPDDIPGVIDRLIGIGFDDAGDSADLPDLEPEHQAEAQAVYDLEIPTGGIVLLD